MWQGDAEYDSDGKFSDCTMTAQVESGVLLGFVISKDYDWGLVLADEKRSFEVGTTEAVVLLVDDRDPIAAIAKVVDVHGIVIPLQSTDPVVDALREGRCSPCRRRREVQLQLSGTEEAIAALAACVTEHLGSEKV